MTQIIVDAGLSGKLNAITQPVELCDAAGRILGQFVPRFDLSEWEPDSSVASDEELDRRERAGEKRYSTAEVFKHLEQL